MGKESPNSTKPGKKEKIHYPIPHIYKFKPLQVHRLSFSMHFAFLTPSMTTKHTSIHTQLLCRSWALACRAARTKGAKLESWSAV